MTNEQKAQPTPEQIAAEALPDDNPYKELAKRIADFDGALLRSSGSIWKQSGICSRP